MAAPAFLGPAQAQSQGGPNPNTPPCCSFILKCLPLCTPPMQMLMHCACCGCGRSDDDDIEAKTQFIQQQGTRTHGNYTYGISGAPARTPPPKHRRCTCRGVLQVLIVIMTLATIGVCAWGIEVSIANTSSQVSEFWDIVDGVDSRVRAAMSRLVHLCCASPVCLMIVWLKALVCCVCCAGGKRDYHTAQCVWPAAGAANLSGHAFFQLCRCQSQQHSRSWCARGVVDPRGVVDLPLLIHPPLLRCLLCRADSSLAAAG